MLETVERTSPDAQEKAVTLVDTDVHPVIHSRQDIIDYLPEPWRSLDYGPRAGGGSVIARIYDPPDTALTKGMRTDSFPPRGGAPGSDPEFAYKQLIEDDGVDLAILMSLQARLRANAEQEAAVIAATNSWLADVWLGEHNKHGRFYGSIRICPDDAALAVEEIERWAGDPRWLQIYMTPETTPAFGNPKYHPIYAAAEKHELPLAIHIIRPMGQRLLTPVGYPAYFHEHSAGIPLYYASHLASMVFEGVFEKYPGLRIVLVEGGFTWLLPLMWRMDAYWRECKSEVPALKRAPSEYVRNHVRFTTQPLEESDLSAFRKLCEWTDAENMLMFSTDYPHFSYDDPKWALNRFPKPIRNKIAAENAIEFYGLPTTVSAA